MTFQTIYIDEAIFNEIIDIAINNDEEVCGILTGKELHKQVAIADKLIQIENVSKQHKQVDYVMNPNQLMKELSKTSFIDKNSNIDWVCIWHSHPNGFAIPSGIDLERAEYNVVYLIYGVAEDRIRCWSYDKEHNDFYEIDLHIVEG